MPRVAVLCEFPTLLGGERSWLAALPAIRCSGFAPVVVAPEGGPLAAALRAAGVEHVAWSVRGEAGHRRSLEALRLELHRLLARLRPSLVHANSLSMTRLAGPVARQSGVCLLGHLRDIVRLSPAAVRDVNCADRLLAVSEATRRFHVAQGIDAHRLHVVYNGVDLLQHGLARGHRTRRILQELEIQEPALLVVAIGQIGQRKGTDVFVELARCVLAMRQDVHFLIVGERTSEKEEAVCLEAALHERASTSPCRGHVHFLGTRQDVPDVLSQVDLVVHPARQEPLGRVLLESAAAGKAIVATDVGGTKEIFPPEPQSALVVPPCQVDEVAKSDLLAATLRLLSSPAEREALGQAARRRAEERFDAREAGTQLAHHYLALLG
jgi:glycosyltransferase involved in cell wall biosynthesis